MNWTAGLAIYLVVWWITLFAVLPWGIRAQADEGEIAAGTEPSAPVAPRLLRKVVITTLVAAALWLVIAWLIVYQPVSFDSIPFMPEFSSEY
jgi:predicted secreted protein